MRWVFYAAWEKGNRTAGGPREDSAAIQSWRTFWKRTEYSLTLPSHPERVHLWLHQKNHYTVLLSPLLIFMFSKCAGKTLGEKTLQFYPLIFQEVISLALKNSLLCTGNPTSLYVCPSEESDAPFRDRQRSLLILKRCRILHVMKSDKKQFICRQSKPLLEARTPMFIYKEWEYCKNNIFQHYIWLLPQF